MINGIIQLYDATPGGIWDAFEINGVRDVGHLAVEACDDSEAQYWSAYIHFVGGTVQCIGDFNTREDAEKFVKFLLSLILLKTGGTIVNSDIAAMIPTLSKRPQVYYDLIRLLLTDGFQFDHRNAEWHNPSTGIKGRICFFDKQAWLRHPRGQTSHHVNTDS